MAAKFEVALANLKSKGLNLFASAKINTLSDEIQNLLRKNLIEFDDHDSIIIIAHGGKELWRHLVHPLKEENDPIDNFSINAMRDFGSDALEGDYKILFPLNSIVLPLQKLGRELNLSRPSPLGLDINFDFGIWFAFRGVMITKKNIPSILSDSFQSPCISCETKDCVANCPVGATSLSLNFNLKACGEFRFKESSDCADRCLARISCPYKSEHRYELEQTKYHMGRASHLKSLASYFSKL